jgi:hypothetical protein
MLSQFLSDLAAARGGPKDAEADRMIHQALSANADAAYLLVQHAIVADQSLHAAQARIAELEQQVREAAPQPQATSFLPSSGGPWGQPAPQRYNPMPEDYEPMPPQQRPGFFSGNSGLGSFLRSAGTTAAGVAGGEMLFSGLSDLFGGHRSGGGFLGGGAGETIINNYDDDSRFDDRNDRDDRDGIDDQGNW